jgi:hypothetical protein
LCIELAAEVAADYPDGLYFVRLAPVREPGLVPSSIAQSIGLPDSRGPSLVEHLANYLRDRRLLLLLDNFEHLLAAAPVVAELLAPRTRPADRGEQPLASSRVGRAGVPGPSAGDPPAGCAHQSSACLCV